MTHTVTPLKKKVPNVKFYRCDVSIVRESILVGRDGNALAAGQAMPKYIPKEPIKACVSSPLTRSGSTLSGFLSSAPLSEGESDSCSLVSHSTLTSHGVGSQHAGSRCISRQHSKNEIKCSRGRRKHMRKVKSKTRPVNVVEPLLAASEFEADRDDVFSLSGAESVDWEEQQRLHDEVEAQKKLISKLEEDLAGQIKVNGELKKLLVASVGADLEYRVEKLAQDKAHLSATVGNYSEKLYKDFEDLDRISIQADMWKSKFLASRVQAEELSRAKLTLNQKYVESLTSLQDMMSERQSIWNGLLTTQRLLQTICNSLHVKTVMSSSPISSQTAVHLTEDITAMATKIAQSKFPSAVTSHSNEINPKISLSGVELRAQSVINNQPKLTPALTVEVPTTESARGISSLFCLTRRRHPPKCQCKKCISEATVI